MSDFLIFTQWQVVAIILVLPAFTYGGLRLGLLAIFAVWTWLGLNMDDGKRSNLA